jgi:hypothetical protein
MTTMQTLLRRPSRHHVTLAERVADTEPLTVDALLVRWALGRRTDRAFADRLRAAIVRAEAEAAYPGLCVEVTERLRGL